MLLSGHSSPSQGQAAGATTELTAEALSGQHTEKAKGATSLIKREMGDSSGQAAQGPSGNWGRGDSGRG